MKKMINLILAVAMFFNCFISNNTLRISAADTNVTVIEDVDWSEVGFSNVKITYRNLNENNETTILSMSNEPIIEIDYIIDDTGDSVHFERIGNVGYHYINDELVTTIDFDIQVMTRSVTIPSNVSTIKEYPNDEAKANGFSYFYYVKQTSWRIKEFESMFFEQVKSKVTSTILNAIVGAATSPVISIAYTLYSAADDMYSYLETLLDIASVLTDGDLNGVDLIYQSFNNQCDILAWYGMSSYMLVNNSINAEQGYNFKKNDNHSWNGHPYDYSQPAACRVLVNTYE